MVLLGDGRVCGAAGGQAVVLQVCRLLVTLLNLPWARRPAAGGSPSRWPGWVGQLLS